MKPKEKLEMLNLWTTKVDGSPKMFLWTEQNVLAAIDAGIREVIDTFNSAHAWCFRQNQRHPSAPPYTLGTAFDFAMTCTITYLNGEEAGIAIGTAVADALDFQPTIYA